MKEKTKSFLIITGIIVIVCSSLFIAGCKNKKSNFFAKDAKFQSATYEDAIVAEEAVVYKSAKTMNSNGRNVAMGALDSANINSLEKNLAQDPERKIVKTGSLSYEVKNLSEAETKINDWLKIYNGYISNTWTNRNTVNITVKIPADKFESAMESSNSFGTLLSRSISTEDVTENFYDLETRLETRRILQDKLSSYLKEAKNISDLLEIERQLNEVTTEIENTEKQFRRLSNQINYSTISISCSLPPKTNDEGFITPSFINKLKDFAYNSIDFIYNLGLSILYIILIGIPLILLIALIYWLGFGKLGLIRKLFNKLKP